MRSLSLYLSIHLSIHLHPPPSIYRVRVWMWTWKCIENCSQLNYSEQTMNRTAVEMIKSLMKNVENIESRTTNTIQSSLSKYIKEQEIPKRILFYLTCKQTRFHTYTHTVKLKLSSHCSHAFIEWIHPSNLNIALFLFNIFVIVNAFVMWYWWLCVVCVCLLVNSGNEIKLAVQPLANALKCWFSKPLIIIMFCNWNSQALDIKKR